LRNRLLVFRDPKYMPDLVLCLGPVLWFYVEHQIFMAVFTGNLSTVKTDIYEFATAVMVRNMKH